MRDVQSLKVTMCVESVDRETLRVPLVFSRLRPAECAVVPGKEER